MNNKVFLQCSSPKDWKNFLASPEKQWKDGFSAKTLAYCWSESNDFPNEIKKTFKDSNIDIFNENIELLLAIPEYGVNLSGKGKNSCNDIFVLAKSKNELIAVAVEGKVSESFGNKVSEWLKNSGENKNKRIEDILYKLGLNLESVQNTYYQLLHRAVSSIILAEKFNCKHALLLIHSFSKSNERFEDYENFLKLFSVKADVNTIIPVKTINGISLYCTWIKGNEKYLRAI